MIINDEYILEYFNNFKSVRKINWKKLPIEIEQYLKNRYNDSLSLKESFSRIKNNIEIKPICPICGNKLIFRNRLDRPPFGIYCSNKCKANSLDWSNKVKYTKFEHFGNEYYNNREKYIQTCKEKFGVENVFQSELVKDKIKNTCLNRYGKDNYSKTKEFYNKINWEEKIKKEIETKRKNNSFNYSKPEEECYQLLKTKYNNIIRQYKSKLYPFKCDFYIKDINLYIEYNGHWFHGQHIFNENDIKDINILNNWKSKNSDIFNRAIKCWTENDPLKRKIAKENNLNYIEFWNLLEVKEWLKN